MEVHINSGRKQSLKYEAGETSGVVTEDVLRPLPRTVRGKRGVKDEALEACTTHPEPQPLHGSLIRRLRQMRPRKYATDQLRLVQ